MRKESQNLTLCALKNRRGFFYLSILFMQFLLDISKISLIYWCEISHKQRIGKFFFPLPKTEKPETAEIFNLLDLLN